MRYFAVYVTSPKVKGDGRITKEIACYALEALNIDRYGLDYIDNKLLGDDHR